MDLRKIQIYCGCGCSAVEIPKAINVTYHKWNTRCYGMRQFVNVYGAGNIQLESIIRFCCRQTILTLNYIAGIIEPSSKAPSTAKPTAVSTTLTSILNVTEDTDVEIKDESTTTKTYSRLMTSSTETVRPTTNPINTEQFVRKNEVYITAILGAVIVFLAFVIFFLCIQKHKRRKRKPLKTKAIRSSELLEDSGNYEMNSQTEGEYSTILDIAEISGSVRPPFGSSVERQSHLKAISIDHNFTGRKLNHNNTDNFADEKVSFLPKSNIDSIIHYDAQRTASYDSLQHQYFKIEGNTVRPKGDLQQVITKNQDEDNSYFILEKSVQSPEAKMLTKDKDIQNTNSDYLNHKTRIIDVKHPLMQTLSVHSGEYHKLHEVDDKHISATDDTYDHVTDFTNTYSQLHMKKQMSGNNAKLK